MRKGTWARLLPALLLVLAPFMEGCGDFWQAPSGSGGGGTTPTTLSSGVFYVLNQTTKQIVAYYINAGSLTTIGTYALTAAPYAIAIAPNNAFLYVATATGGIYLYTIGSTGALTIGNNGQAISSDLASAMVVDTTGAWLIDAETGGSGVIVNAIAINSSGTLASSQEQEETQSYKVTGASVQKMALSGDDANIFLALGEGGSLVIPFTSANTNPLASSASTIVTVTSGASALSVAVDPGTTPRLFYVGETEASSSSGGLRAFEYSSLGGSSVTEIAGSPYSAGGLAPAAILPDTAGNDVYVASGQGTTGDGVLQGFNIATSTSGSTTTYSLSSISTVATGIQPQGLAEDSLGNFVLAVSSGGSYDLEAYIFDTTTAGKLDDSINSTTGTDPTGAWAVAAQAP
ncbi:MAG: beta-propeller fold lactonase family protein [Terracidiphilus sp.]